jgi:hypothetical protein
MATRKKAKKAVKKKAVKKKAVKRKSPPRPKVKPREPEPLATGAERRRHRRVPKELKIRLYAGADQGTRLEAILLSSDVSLSGVFLRSTFFMPEGIPVRVEVETPLGDVAEVQGVVARVQRAGANQGFGIHFTQIDAETLRHLVALSAGDDVLEFVERFAYGRSAKEQAFLSEGILTWEAERLERG